MTDTTPPLDLLDHVEPRYLRCQGARRYTSIPLRTLDIIGEVTP